MNKRAFTLIELLVVIAVIGILAAFLVPTFGRARENARQAQCSNNLRQIGVAMHLYIDDHDFKFPPIKKDDTGDDWYNHYLVPYIDDPDVYKCPSYKYHDGSRYHLSYGFNYLGLNYSGPFRGKDINAVTNPTQCIMVADSSRWGSDDLTVSYYAISKGAANRPLGDRHSDGANIVFVDGHVKWHRTSDVPISGAESTIWWNY